MSNDGKKGADKERVNGERVAGYVGEIVKKELKKRERGMERKEQ